MIRLWKWLYSVAKEKVDRYNHDHHPCSVRCPWCKTWSWETDGVKRWEYNDTGDLVIMTCKYCERDSKWDNTNALPCCITEINYTPLDWEASMSKMRAALLAISKWQVPGNMTLDQEIDAARSLAEDGLKGE